MHKMIGKSVVLVGCLAFVMIFVSVVEGSGSNFVWSDCGVQLDKRIHYQSASISPDTATPGQSLAINVQATISDTVIYDADTRLMVWKDGDIFLDVKIDKLCAILSNTQAIKCPLQEGTVSFTYNFAKVPQLVTGKYVIQIKSYDGSVGVTDTTEIGCIQFNGTVKALQGNYADDKCLYKSSFATKINGDAHYTNSNVTLRKKGDWIQVGPMGNLTTSGTSFPYGTFVGDFLASPDLGGSMKSDGYTWALNGTLDNRVGNSQATIDMYSGTFYVLYQNAVYYTGYFNWTITYPVGGAEQIVGSMTLNPEYYYNKMFTWPVTVGNLGPFNVRTEDGTTILIVDGEHLFCTCGVDACGVCNGNGRSCGLGSPDNSHHWGPRKIAAVVCGIIAAILLVIVIDLSRRIHRRRSGIPIDDTDLLDHPEKPDYGTMAIDDAIREGERVVV